MRRFLYLLPILLLLSISPQPARLASAAPTANTSDAFVYFPETGHNVGLKFKQFYDVHGGLDIFGLPLTEVTTDIETGLQVQYFERARFELHPDPSGESTVSLSLIGSTLTKERTEPAFTWLTSSLDPNRTFFRESGHTLGGAFGWFWQTRGGLPVFGYPISEEFTELNPADGKLYLVQYFQRARFEYHPENQGTPYEVMLGALGRQLLDSRPDAWAAATPTRPIESLGKATTSFATSIFERRHNIARATATFNGLVVPPATEFSFNATGDFSEKNGFVDGYAIVGGRLERVVGGGLCQVSTTMFRAVSNAGLEITQRSGHTFIVYFYENILGFDATVFTPSVDFRWYNDTPGPIYIAAESNPEAATVTFSLWGYNDGRTVAYAGPYTRNWVKPGKAVWQLDPSMPPNAVDQLVHGRDGVDVNYMRTVTMSNGRVLHQDNFFTRYQPWEDFYIYGSGVKPPPGVTVLPPKR